jgi:hypothetical protein
LYSLLYCFGVGALTRKDPGGQESRIEFSFEAAIFNPHHVPVYTCIVPNAIVPFPTHARFGLEKSNAARISRLRTGRDSGFGVRAQPFVPKRAPIAGVANSGSK